VKYNKELPTQVKKEVILFKPSLSFGCDGALIKNQFIKLKYYKKKLINLDE